MSDYSIFYIVSHSVYGVLILHCGQVMSTATHHIGFVFPPDSCVINDITKKPLMDSQKPVAFYKSLLQLHTVKGEWVLNGYSGVGMFSYCQLYN